MSTHSSSQTSEFESFFSLVFRKLIRYLVVYWYFFKAFLYGVYFLASLPILMIQSEINSDIFLSIRSGFESSKESFFNQFGDYGDLSLLLNVIGSLIVIYFVPWLIKERIIKTKKIWFYLSCISFALVLAYEAYFLINGIGYELAYYPLFIGCIVVTIFLVRAINPGVIIDYIGKEEPKSSHGSSRFYSDGEVKYVLNKNNNGLVIDGVRRVSLNDSFENCLVVAPTGSGKTQSYVLPNILKADGYSIIITDPSGEIYATCGAHLLNQGYDIRVIRPYNLDNSDRYNPLQHITSLSEAKVVSKTIVSQLESKGDPYWHIAASQLCAGLIMLLSDVSTGKSYLNFTNIRRLLLKSEEEIKLICDQFGTDATKEEVYQSFAGSEKAKEGIKSTLLTAIELFSSENFKELTSSHNIDFSDLREKKTALFLIIPEEKIKVSKSFVSLFYTQLFEYLLSNESGLPVFAFLEEFANTGYVPDFSQIITVSRKRRVSISIVIQEIDQIEKLYKGQLETIISGGCQHKLFYSGLGLKTSEYVSKLLGESTIDVVSKTEVSFKEGKQIQSTGRKLMTPDEVRRIGRKEALYITQNKYPMRLTVMRDYENKELIKLTNNFDKEIIPFVVKEAKQTLYVPFDLNFNSIN